MAEVKSKTQGSRPRSRTQKIQDLGYTFQGQILLRPRTGLLEAKAKDTAQKKKTVFQKKRSTLKMFASFPQTSGNLKKNKKKGFRPQIHKISTKFVRQKLFLQVLLRAPRRNNIAHDIGTFSTGQKIVQVFEPRTCRVRGQS